MCDFVCVFLDVCVCVYRACALCDHESLHAHIHTHIHTHALQHRHTCQRVTVMVLESDGYGVTSVYVYRECPLCDYEALHFGLSCEGHLCVCVCVCKCVCVTVLSQYCYSVCVCVLYCASTRNRVIFPLTVTTL
jgi:hypothetical protein